MITTDDVLVHNLSYRNEEFPDENSWPKVQRTYGLTQTRSKAVIKAAICMREKRAVGLEVWHLCSIKLPPCYKDVLFDDGDEVYPGKVDDLVTNYNDMLRALLKNTTREVGDPVWWSELPRGARDYYGLKV